MATKEQLIHWMKERRESLPFESKVELIWDYWKNKDLIPNLRKDVESWKTAYEIERSKNQTLDKKIAEKDDRNAQLYKLFDGTKQIFLKQHNYVDQLKKQLEKESQDKNISQEQAQHLQEDIGRLDNEKQELGERVKELEEEETKNKNLRDKELADLRAEKKDLEVREKQVYDILGKYSAATGLLARSQELVKEIDNMFPTHEEIAWMKSLDDFSFDRNGLHKETQAIINTVPKTPLKSLGTLGSARISKIARLADIFYQQYSQLLKEISWWDKWKMDIVLKEFNRYPQFYWTKTNIVQNMSIEKGINFIKRFQEEVYQYYRDK